MVFAMKRVIKILSVLLVFCLFIVCCACDVKTVPAEGSVLSGNSSQTSSVPSSSAASPGPVSSAASSEASSKPASPVVSSVPVSTAGSSLPSPNLLSTSVIQSYAEIKALTVNAQNNLDFPSASGLSSAQLTAEITKIVDFAAEYGFNTLYLETNPQTDALYLSGILPSSSLLVSKQGGKLPLNVLETFIAYAHQKNIQVYAMISPGLLVTAKQAEAAKNAMSDPSVFSYKQLLSSSHPVLSCGEDVTVTESSGAVYLDLAKEQSRTLLADSVQELVTHYGVDGVLIENDFASSATPSDITKLFTALGTAVKQSGRDIPLGFENSADLKTASSDSFLFSGVVSQNLADFAVFSLPYATSGTDFSYSSALAKAKQLLSGSNVALYSLNSASQAVSGSLPYYELNYQVTQNRLSGIGGEIIDSYSALAGSKKVLTSLYSALSQGKISYSFPTSVSQSFAVTRPSADISTTTSTYYIMGTSTPGSAVYLNGTALTDVQGNGLFGVFVSLSEGKNAFTFQQNGKTVTRTITRTIPSSGVSPISVITQGSMFPSIEGLVSETEDFTVTCTAPSGATVTAEAAGFSVTLTQTSTANAGYPATFTGTLNFNDSFNDDETVNSGKIRYTLTHNGSIVAYSSTGDLFVTGKDIHAVGVVSNNVEIVYEKPNNSSTMLSLLTNNATDYITEANGAYYKLAMGGYVYKTDVVVQEGKNTIDNDIQSIGVTSGTRSDTFTLKGAGNITYLGSLSDSKLTVTLYNTTKLPDTSSLSGSMIQSVTAQQGDNSITLTFNAKNGVTLWSYDVYYGDEDTAVIYIKQKPVLPGGVKKPLNGVTVVLDPGHGGTDSGAVGIPGTGGPVEKEATLVISNAVKAYLEQLGATVTLLRTDDTFVYVYDRPMLTRNIEPDFFISIHQNSIAVQSDGGKSKGMEAYYYSNSSAAFSKLLVSNLSARLNRVRRGAFQSSYIVTRTYCAPALLLEIGFVCNPAEYNDMLDSFQIYKTAEGIAQTMIESLE